jgi:hypothetical protein
MDFEINSILNFVLKFQNVVTNNLLKISNLNKNEGTTKFILLLSLTLIAAVIISIYFRRNSKVKVKLTKQTEQNSPVVVNSLHESKHEIIMADAVVLQSNKLKSNSLDSSNQYKPVVISHLPNESPLKTNNESQDHFRERSPSQSSKNGQNVDSFVRRLRVTGFKVRRIKKNIVKEQRLKLNSRADVTWSTSIFSKKQPILSLVSAFSSDKGFILEFKNKVVHFEMFESEKPYDADLMIKYFNLIIDRLGKNNKYVLDVCKSNISTHDHDESSSVYSDSTNGLSKTPIRQTSQSFQGLPAVSENK